MNNNPEQILAKAAFLEIKQKSNANKKDKDETYVINLCDKILNEAASRQHRFDFLKGDTGVKLPVDAYYENYQLVIEYNEKQHTESVKLFDNKKTVSGVTRDIQRRIYDERRKEVLPKHGIELIVFSYDDFDFDNRKRIKRNQEKDLEIVREKLKKFITPPQKYKTSK